MHLIPSGVTIAYEIEHRVPERNGNDISYKWRFASVEDSFEDAVKAYRKVTERYPTLEVRIVKTTKEIFTENRE